MIGRFVFLDFDGVLTHAGHVSTPGCYFDPECVRRVDALCRRVGAGIVLSTSWKQGDDPEDPEAYEWPPATPERMSTIDDMLRSAGLKIDIIGATPNLATGQRGLEIDLWLRRNGVSREQVVVLDDLAPRLMRPVVGRLVSTAYARGGFSEARFDVAMSMFGGRPPSSWTRLRP